MSEVMTAKSGKHGAAKMFVTYIDPKTGSKKDKIMNSNDELEIVTVAKGLNSYFKKSYDDLIRG